MKIFYFGYNSFKAHKRGTENVIDFQLHLFPANWCYYFHWDKATRVYKGEGYTGIAIRKCWYWPLILNVILLKLRKKGPFIIHSHNALFSIAGWLKTDLMTVHDGLYYLAKSKKHRAARLFYLLEHYLYSRCGTVHFISNYTKSQSLFGKRKNYSIIPNTSHFEALVPASLLSLDNNSCRSKSVLIVRSIEERARFDLLTEVAQRLQAAGYQFTVAGKGPLFEQYKETFKTISNITMLGYVPDEALLQLYRECGLVLVLAEYGEGFGLPIIEGYLFNKPVVASEACAIPEVIISPDYLCQNTPESICSRLEYAHSHMENGFRTHYDEHFSNQIIAGAIKHLIHHIIKQKYHGNAITS